jgi:MFS family permease
VSIAGWQLELFNLNIIVVVLVTIYPIGFMFLPETPIFLLGKEKSEEAVKSMKIIRGPSFDSESEICELQKGFEENSNAPKSSFTKEIRKRATFKALIIIITLFFVFQMSGINAVIFYATTIFIESGISIDPFLATIILALMEVFATIFSASIVDRFGRVALLKASLTLTFTGLVGIGSYFMMKEHNVSFLEHFTWLPLPSLCVFVFGFSIGLATVPFILLGEVFSDEAKKVIAPLGQTMNNSMSFGIGLFYPLLVNGIGSGMTFFMFAAFVFFGLIFTIVIPETKGKSLAEIQKLLEAKS